MNKGKGAQYFKTEGLLNFYFLFPERFLVQVSRTRAGSSAIFVANNRSQARLEECTDLNE